MANVQCLEEQPFLSSYLYQVEIHFHSASHQQFETLYETINTEVTGIFNGISNPIHNLF